MNTIKISFKWSGDIMASVSTGKVHYIGRADSDGEVHLFPGSVEVSYSEIIAGIVDAMNGDPDMIGHFWNPAFTIAAVKAGYKNRAPAAYLMQAGIDEYREPNMSAWESALEDALDRFECYQEDGMLNARFWTDGDRVWATPCNIVEPGARRIEYTYEKGVGYVPIDL